MSKKKHKKQNKQKDIFHIRCHELAEQVGNELLSGQTATVEFTYEGKIYKGTVPCVGVIE